ARPADRRVAAAEAADAGDPAGGRVPARAAPVRHLSRSPIMLSKSKLAGLLADRIDRLRGALAALRRSVRDRVAEVVGAAVADAVRDTVRIAPDPPAPALPAAPAARCEAYDPWGGPDPGDWADDDPICDREPDTWGYPRPADAGGTAEPAATPARAGGPERADLAGAAGRPVAPGACGCRR